MEIFWRGKYQELKKQNEFLLNICLALGIVAAAAVIALVILT